jgi:hypothetical protein
MQLLERLHLTFKIMNNFRIYFLKRAAKYNIEKLILFIIKLNRKQLNENTLYESVIPQTKIDRDSRVFMMDHPTNHFQYQRSTVFILHYAPSKYVAIQFPSQLVNLIKTYKLWVSSFQLYQP